MNVNGSIYLAEKERRDHKEENKSTTVEGKKLYIYIYISKT